MSKSIRLQQLPGAYAIARLEPTDRFPPWADGAGFVSIARNVDELSIVCLQERIPAAVKTDRDWTAFRFVGPFAFGETGIVLSVIRPLSEGGLGVFVVSTFDGDHLLLKTTDLQRGRALLLEAGHQLPAVESVA
jgi:uncharacterized protein